jgi:predicted SprT family Zn-dependent metalloprotease
MRVEDAKELAEIAIDAAKMKGWKLVLKNTYTTIGSCSLKTKTIHLSIPFIKANTVKVIKETICHEICHACNTPHDTTAHGPTWKSGMAALGYPNAKACSSAEDGIKPPEPNWYFRCEECKRAAFSYYPVIIACKCEKDMVRVPYTEDYKEIYQEYTKKGFPILKGK